jgi:hypothetical protein
MEVFYFHPPILYNKRNIFLGKGYGINYGAIGKISWVTLTGPLSKKI